MDWADVTWFEWCDQILIQSSRNLKKTSRVINRIHSYEIFTNFPAQVNWQFIDIAMFVAPHIERLFHEMFPTIVKTKVIPNGVNLEQFEFKERSKSFNLAYVGYLNFKKNPELLLQCMAELVSRDARYRLHIAGEFQDMRYKYYFEQLIPALGIEQNIVFDGWVEDIDAWLEDKSYIVSTSVLESFGFGIAEAMAKGMKPVIHNWVGAKEVYPEKYIFNTPKEFADLVCANNYDSAEYRSYIRDNFSLPAQISELKALFTDTNFENNTTPTNAGLSLPRNNFIVTGIPRSGTSLLSRIYGLSQRDSL